MRLHADEYHLGLDEDDRLAVDVWLESVFGTADEVKRLLIVEYEVIGEGQVLFTCMDSRNTSVKRVATPPPVWRHR